MAFKEKKEAPELIARLFFRLHWILWLVKIILMNEYLNGLCTQISNNKTKKKLNIYHKKNMHTLLWIGNFFCFKILHTFFTSIQIMKQNNIYIINGWIFFFTFVNNQFISLFLLIVIFLFSLLYLIFVFLYYPLFG